MAAQDHFNELPALLRRRNFTSFGSVGAFNSEENIVNVQQSCQAWHHSLLEMSQHFDQCYLNNPQEEDDDDQWMIPHLIATHPAVWRGTVTIRDQQGLDATAEVFTLFVSGKKDIAIHALGLPLSTIRIHRKIKLNSKEIERFWDKIKESEEHCILLLTPDGNTIRAVEQSCIALDNYIVDYFVQQRAAGMAYAFDGTFSYLLHFIPPCQFTNRHLHRKCPILMRRLGTCSVMTVVITKHWPDNKVHYNPGRAFTYVRSPIETSIRDLLIDQLIVN